jgi:hypothetical protein
VALATLVVVLITVLIGWAGLLVVVSVSLWALSVTTTTLLVIFITVLSWRTLLSTIGWCLGWTTVWSSSSWSRSTIWSSWSWSSTTVSWGWGSVFRGGDGAGKSNESVFETHFECLWNVKEVLKN